MQQMREDGGIGKYQPAGKAWNPFRDDIVELMERADEVAIQPIYYGSNHTFLVTLDAGPAGRSLAVYKPARGEYPLYDFPNGSLYKREVAVWLVDAILGWGLVPPTVVARGGYGVGSLQLFIETVDAADIALAELQRMTLLDLVVNNADRKGEHCLVADGGKLWGIDHGLTFHTQPKLRTVLWHFAGRSIPRAQVADLQALGETLERSRVEAARQLHDLLSRAEWIALQARIGRLVETLSFPDPRYKSVPYRW